MSEIEFNFKTKGVTSDGELLISAQEVQELLYDLHAELQNTRTQSQWISPELEKVINFLLGQCDIDGFWFNERPEGEAPFWWRKHLRKALPPKAGE